MKFREPDEVEIIGDDDDVCGTLKRRQEGFAFHPRSEYESFTASDLRAIADELDKRNGEE